MTKLLHEHRVFDRKMGSISRNASFTPNESNLKVKENQNKVFTKVVLRCIIYPLGRFGNHFFLFPCK
jgi:hypothetical protein